MTGRSPSPRKTIAVVATTSFALRVYIALHIQALSKQYNIVIFSNFDGDPCSDLFSPDVTLVHIPFARKIHLKTDIQTLFTLYKALLGGQFDAVHSLMPKSGLLAMVAGYAARIPLRIHLFTGQVWANKIGLKRALLKFMDKVNVWFSTDILVDSPSQRDFLTAENVVKDAKVLGIGSVCGVDINRFHPNATWRDRVRADFGIAQDTFVFGYVGRMNPDKGVMDLATAFAGLYTTTDVSLVFVGPDEENMQAAIMNAHPDLVDRIFFTGHTDQPELFMNAFDVFCLPSYREGFGSTVIEAAACKVPALVSRIYGLTDAVEDGVTGLFHTPGDFEDIQKKMCCFLDSTDMRTKMAQAAFKRCHKEFSSDRIVGEMLKFYDRRL